MATPADTADAAPREWSEFNPFRRQLMAAPSTTPEFPSATVQSSDEPVLSRIDTNQTVRPLQFSPSKTVSPSVKLEQPGVQAIIDDPFGIPSDTSTTATPIEARANEEAMKLSRSQPVQRPNVTFVAATEDSKADTKSASIDSTPRQKLASHPGRASLDVDAFKRLMLTGNAGAAPAPSNENSSATSSLSRQSLFETIPEAGDSPRSSHDLLDEVETEKKVEKKREKPPPPKPRHGKLIQSQMTKEPEPLKSSDLESNGEESTPDLSIPVAEKSLPALPTTESSSSVDREDVQFPTIDISEIPPESPTVSTPSKKVPPPPPINRRASIINRTKSSSSVSSLSLTSPPPNRPSSISSAQGIPPMGSKPAPTPPPPRRRQSNASIASRDMVAIQEDLPLRSPEIPQVAVTEEFDDRQSLVEEDPSPSPGLSQQSAPKTKSSLPPPRPPTRAPSSAKRNKAVRSSVILPSASSTGSGTMAPPPPPKPRRASGGSMRSGTDDSRRESVASSRIEEDTEENIDYLAEEVKKLQAEVDALRRRASTEEQ